MPDMNKKKKLLLHSCCGPCSTAVLERLYPDYDITVFFYNPNITDPEEYEHRLSEQERFISEWKPGEITLIKGEYDPKVYLDFVSGLEDEPEGGARCTKCFMLRMEEAARFAKEHGFECFDTTLTVSPYKNSKIIMPVGIQMGEKYGIEYIEGNYKKKDGYRRSVELSKEYGLYRQHYCGCEFSKRDALPEDENGMPIRQGKSE